MGNSSCSTLLSSLCIHHSLHLGTVVCAFIKTKQGVKIINDHCKLVGTSRYLQMVFLNIQYKYI